MCVIWLSEGVKNRSAITETFEVAPIANALYAVEAKKMLECNHSRLTDAYYAPEHGCQILVVIFESPKYRSSTEYELYRSELNAFYCSYSEDFSKQPFYRKSKKCVKTNTMLSYPRGIKTPVHEKKLVIAKNTMSEFRILLSAINALM